MRRIHRSFGRALVGAALLSLVACDDPGPTAAAPEASAEAAGTRAASIAEPSLRSALERDLQLDRPAFGDLDAIAQRRRLRVLVTHNKTHYFVHGGRPRGITYEACEAFEKFLNARRPRGELPIRVVYVPVPRSRLLPALLEGRGDLAAANLTVTSARAEQVAFSAPLLSGVREVVVGRRGEPDLSRPEDLSGREIWVRRSSSYFESLERLNERLTGLGLAPARVREADEKLETEDLLEMVNAGLLPLTVADDYLAAFWADVFGDLRVHEGAALREGGAIAWAFRPGSPQLSAALGDFAAEHRRGTLFGNVILKRYLRSNPWVRNADEAARRERFLELIALFRKYAERYQLDSNLVAAQAYQESGLDHSRRSRAGAVGIMQVLPSTARSPEVGIPDVEQLEPNIHAGVKYLRLIVDRYFDDPGIDPLNRQLFALAAYNAGPSRIKRLRAEAAARGLDPDQWFGHTELAVADHVGREPVQYVANIYKYYVAYSLLFEEARQRERARDRLSGG